MEGVGGGGGILERGLMYGGTSAGRSLAGPLFERWITLPTE